MLAADQISRFYRHKKMTDVRYTVRTVQDLFLDGDDEVDDDEDDDDRALVPQGNPRCARHIQSDLADRNMGYQARLRTALNKNRFFDEELYLAVELLATERANLMLERHLAAVSRERGITQFLKKSLTNHLQTIFKSKGKEKTLESSSSGAPPHAARSDPIPIRTSILPSTATSTSTMGTTQTFRTSIVLENRLRKNFPTLLEQSRKLTNETNAIVLQNEIKALEDALSYLHTKVEAVVSKKAYRKPSTKSSSTSTSTSNFTLTTLATPRTTASDDKRRKRKQLIPTLSTTGNTIENFFRDVVGQLAVDSRSTSRSASTTDSFRQVTIEIINPEL